jgi:hypothetical protein
MEGAQINLWLGISIAILHPPLQLYSWMQRLGGLFVDLGDGWWEMTVGWWSLGAEI